MSGEESLCEYVLDPDEPNTWGGEQGDKCYIDERDLNDDGVWTCPHSAEEGARLCIFHRSMTDKEESDVIEALSEALKAAADSSTGLENNRACEFVGAKFARVEIEAGTVIENHVQFDHASIRDGFLAEDVDFRGGMSAKGATFGSENRDDPPATSHGPWPPLDELIRDEDGKEDHGYFPPDNFQSEQHVSFCDADFVGDAEFDGACFKGIRHVSFSHTDFGGEGDVSFRTAKFENSGHVAFNKADFENNGTVSFAGAVFRDGDVSFSVTDFENNGDVSFEEGKFLNGNKIAFHDSDFLNDAGVSFTNITLENVLPGERRDVNTLDFRGSTFTEDVAIKLTGTNIGSVSFFDADFSRATLAIDVDAIPDVSFESANLTDVDLSEVDLAGVNLERAQLTSADLFGANLSGARIYGARIGDTAINTETVFDERGDYRCVYDPQSNYEYDSDSREQIGQIRKAMGAYHVLEELTRANTLPDEQAKFFTRRQDMRRTQLSQDGRRLDYWFAEAQNAVFRHGESFSRVVAWAAGTIVIFALIFPVGGWLQNDTLEPLTYETIVESPTLMWQSFYHSALLFLTGSGPLVPNGFVGEVLTTIEAMIAPILLALLVFVLGRRAAR